MLDEQYLREQVYPDLSQSLYWNESWDPELYIEVARAGFISITHWDPQLGAVLMPELQRAYAVLDWEGLHCSRNLRRLMRSQQLAEEGVELCVVDSVARVLDRLREQHGRTWIVEPYEALVQELPHGDDAGFSLRGVELWSTKRGEVVAGELGYTIGSTYSSLSGFCSPKDPTLRGFGTLQMYMLASLLRDSGYAFWNLGHTSQKYKRDLGARILPRPVFLERWLAARDAPPSSGLVGRVLEVAEAQSA